MKHAPLCRGEVVLLIGCAWILWERSWSSIGKIGNQWEVAGALAKEVDQRVCPYVYGIESTDVRGP
jgi:hypothetical protein